MDPVTNFARGIIVGGIDATATEFNVRSIVSPFPDAEGDGEFDAIIYNKTDHPAIITDEFREWVRVTANPSGAFTVTRGQQETSAHPHNLPGREYAIELVPSAKLFQDIYDAIAAAGGGGGGNPRYPISEFTSSDDLELGLNLVDASGGTATMALPAISGLEEGDTVIVVKLNADWDKPAIVDPGSDEIQGSTADKGLYSQFEAAEFVVAGGNWIVKSHYIPSNWFDASSLITFNTTPFGGTQSHKKILARRVGDSLELEMDLICTDYTANPARIDFPSYFAFNTAKLQAGVGRNRVGKYHGTATGVNFYRHDFILVGHIGYDGSDDDALYCYSGGSSGTAWGAANAASIWGDNTNAHFNIDRLPIAGWWQ